jgi:hypothetical protein
VCAAARSIVHWLQCDTETLVFKSGATPLLFAAFSNQVEIALCLLAKGADVRCQWSS